VFRKSRKEIYDINMFNIFTTRYSQNTLKNKSENTIHDNQYHLRVSTGTRDRKFDTLIQVLIALAVGCWLIYGTRE
jgi:hypothetical protein